LAAAWRRLAAAFLALWLNSLSYRRKVMSNEPVDTGTRIDGPNELEEQEST
jgi:hypothetical protein